MKTITKTQQQKSKRTNSNQNQKLNQVQAKRKESAAKVVELEDSAEQFREYDSYYKQLSEEVETIERHVRELRQTPGLEHLTETEAQAQVDFMLRYSAWIFNQHSEEQLRTTIADLDDPDVMAVESADVVKVQKRLARVTKKVTKSLTR
ncbi:hypothetical protein [uncultured Pontibacter sp.]|uniref:hypothetical protein n=1 Tax=uncultured Pontibacter sp. TaxID=453356 RepID=UPI00262CF98D|nr:hypothetical protein [uncultured Pontibacter sp.]